MLAEKFTEDTPLPLQGSVGYLTGTGQRARVLRHDGGTALVQLFERHPKTWDWIPVGGSTGNRTVDTVDLHATVKAAVNAGRVQRAAPSRRKSAPRRKKAA